jgi:hypothetical protein
MRPTPKATAAAVATPDSHRGCVSAVVLLEGK